MTMGYRIYGSVGKRGKNSLNDVKLVQALLNVYQRQKKSASLTINGKVDDTMQALIEAFQKKERKTIKPDGRIDAHGKTFRTLVSLVIAVTRKPVATSKPKEGSVTFDSEGAEGGPYHSRILHVPGSWSGLTLGRGYDMKTKSAAKIVKELTKVGIGGKDANLLAKAHGLKGQAAKQFIIDNDLLDFQISPQVQKALFKISYEEESKEAKRLCKLKAYEEEYGKCDWDKLDMRIRQIVVDLKFRGDYTRTSAKYIQKHIAKNDLAEFKKAMSKSSYWKNVPKDRFDRRIKFLQQSVELK